MTSPTPPMVPKSAAPPISISSPLEMEKVPKTFTVAGKFDTGLGAMGVSCGAELGGGGTSGPFGHTTFDTRRGVWAASITVAATGIYKVTAELYGSGGAVGCGHPHALGCAEVKVEVVANPAMVVGPPAPGDEVTGLDLDVVVALTAGHPFTSVDIDVCNLDGTVDVDLPLPDPVTPVTPKVTHTFTVSKANDYVVVVTGDDGTGATVVASVGPVTLG